MSRINLFRGKLSFLLLLSFTSISWGQVPPPVGPPVPVAPVAPAAPGAVATPAAGGGNLYSFITRTPAQREAKRARFCNSLCGKIYGSLLGPVNAFAGGLIPSPCAAPLQQDLAQPADSAVGAAARIQADELEAKKRRAAVRYLSTVDCRRWPEAEEALILALRGDRNECVRFEAALALGRGCCCTPKTIEAMSITVAGSTRDGFPEERSKRVREAARVSLEHCLACLRDPGPLGPPVIGHPIPMEPAPVPLPPPTKKVPDPKEKKEGAKKETAKAAPPRTLDHSIRKASYYQRVGKLPMIRVATYAKKTMNRTQTNPTHQGPHHKRPSGVLDIIGRAWNTPTTTVQPGTWSSNQTYADSPEPQIIYMGHPQPRMPQQQAPRQRAPRQYSGGLINRLAQYYGTTNNSPQPVTYYETVEFQPVTRQTQSPYNQQQQQNVGRSVRAWMDR